MSLDKQTDWSIDQSRDIYNIAHWSDGYFDINDNGELIAYPNGKRDNGAINLLELTQAIHNLGLAMPTLVRFTDILTHRFDSLRNAFTQAIAENNYQAKFTGVYPIKVNQQRRVVEAIIKHGEEPVGLEAGSKPELMIVLALSTPGSVVVCNGYKDREYIRLALIGQRLGYKVYIILEKLSELATIFEESRKMQLTPCLGIRVRLASMGAGKWQDTGGEKSKFGFSAVQVLQVIERLKAASALDTLQLLHFHLGSQIANILDIQRALRECGRYYVELRALGVPIHTVDVGGGLGVDYEGTHSRSFCSMNYSIQEYANNIVYTLAEVCNEKDAPHPNIITESGRAMTAHHALLITNVIDVERAFIPEEAILPAQSDETEVIKNLWDSYSTLSERSALEAYHDACYWISEVRSTYLHGIISLAVCARAEQLYLAICHRVRQLLKPSIRAHREIIDELNEKLADKYFTNFSLFQSIPDTWAIDQIFPILPLSGLQNKPDRRGILQDITCDSDGRIECYVDGQGVETTLPLLPFTREQPYLIGIFLVGAYQEILGDLHNLFGDTDSVHVELTNDGGYQLVHPLQGDTVESVLRYVQFDAKDLLQSYRQQFAHAGLSAEETQNCLQELIAGLHGYTYLED